MIQVGRAALVAWLPLWLRGCTKPAVSSVDQIEPVSKADAETLSSCCLPRAEPGIFPAQQLSFTTGCWKPQWCTLTSLFAHLCLERALRIIFDIKKKSQTPLTNPEINHRFLCFPQGPARLSLHGPGSLHTHQIPLLTSAVGHREHVIRPQNATE